MAEQVDTVVIGAGVIGIACGRALALAGREVLLLERNAGIGEETSARNSEVVHAGLYYPTGSSKERLCVAGRRMLYRYADDRGVEVRRTGKWIVANGAEQVRQLAKMHEKGRSLAIPLRRIEAGEARGIEPALRADAVLESPESGIIDSHALMLALLGDFQRAGGQLVTHASVRGIEAAQGGHRLQVDSGGISEVIASRVVNAAGHGAHALAQAAHDAETSWLPPACLAKGSYFSLSGASPFARLVYPLPEPGGLGIHLTLDLAGQARFGPDVEWVDAPDYALDPSRRHLFAERIRHYWPDCDAQRLQPAYAGIRPKLGTPDSLFPDFLIAGSATHGAPGLVHLLGIESPGLTASLAIAEEVRFQLGSAHRG